MWPFKRKNSNVLGTNVPPEVQNYYQAERRQRLSVAWLLGAGTLVATLVLAVGIFFGGRWLYRSLHHTSTSTATSQGKSDVGPSKTPSAASSTPSTPKPTPSTSSAQPSTPTASAPSSSPATGDNLPHTGPDGDD